MRETRPGPTEVTIRWSEKRGGAVKKATESLSAELINNSDQVVEGRLVLVATGLDALTAQLSLGNFTLPAGESTSIAVPIKSLPVQSETGTSFADLEVELDRPGGVVHLSTVPIYYIFSEGYTRAEFYSAGEVAKLANGGVRSDNAANVKGRVVDSGGTLREVDHSAAPVAEDGSSPSFTMARSMAQKPEKATWVAASVAAGAAAADATMKVCANWYVRYIDGGFGEDYWATSAWNWRAASFVWMDVWDGSGYYWSGYTDKNGCSPYIAVPSNRQVVAQQWTDARDADYGIGSVLTTYPGYQDSYTVTALYVTTPASGRSAVRYLYPTYNDPAIQSQAIGGYLLYRNRLRLDAALDPLVRGTASQIIHNFTDKMHVGTSKCVGSDPLIGGNEYYGGHDSSWKFIVAHEIGHCARNLDMGLIYSDYGDTDTQHEMCRCDYIPGDSAHCLQSRETFGAASNEGYAHTFATRLFNVDTTSEATFVYYKPYHFPEEVRWPPMPVNGYGPILWMESKCAAEQHRGVEWDWLAFTYHITNRDYAHRYTLQDFNDVYRVACRGSTSEKCSSNDPWWSKAPQPGDYPPYAMSLVDAAWYLYGQGRLTWDQANRFQLAGGVFGVAH